MRIAFYAPMNAPDDAAPSGDRLIARQIMKGLEELGHQVELISRLKTWSSDPRDLDELKAKAAAEITRIMEGSPREAPFDAWFTYHSYYKAPDLLGRDITQACGIPYFVAEASISPRRIDGPWAEGARLAQDTAQAADRIFSTCPRDIPALEAHGIHRHCQLRPWIDVEAWTRKPEPGCTNAEAATEAISETGLRLHTTAMMRDGDKLESYALLAASLKELTIPWSLTITGNGPAFAKVEDLFAEFGPRINFTGALDHRSLKMTYEAADIFVWPGLGEGLGLVYLEAQAAGLPVVAVDGPGIRGALDPDAAHLTEQSPRAFAKGMMTLAEPKTRASLGLAARHYVEVNHSKAQFLRTLRENLKTDSEMTQ